MEITVVSGKGGTGKTTLSVAIAELEKQSIKVDCDVDAPNLYLYYGGKTIQNNDFSGAKVAAVNQQLCTRCGECQGVCQFDAIENGRIKPYSCEGCGACALICPAKAITLMDEKTAELLLTDTGKGLLSHSNMAVGSEGSGKLITVLRKQVEGQLKSRVEGQTQGQTKEREKFTIIDASPGIGCPVISSITSTDAVIAVTEPTQSGLEDLKRVVTLCTQFGIQTFVCVNKADINEELSEQIQRYCEENNVYFAGKIPFDNTVLCSINELKPIIYYEESAANQAIRQIWTNIKTVLNK